MIMTLKHEKLLTMAANPRGVNADLYTKEALELRAAGRLELRAVYTATGNRKWHHFAADAA